MRVRRTLARGGSLRRANRARPAFVVALLGLVLSSGCILRPPPEPPSSGHRPPAVATRFARLTHTEWANTVHDLFGIDVASDLRLDPNQSGFLFDNYAASLSVDEALWDGYRRAAVALAERVAQDPAQVARLSPQAGGTNERARRFIESFGARVHRRPLSEGQVQQYLELFAAGRGAYAGLGELEAGLRLTLEGMLQSPFFLYRVEGSGGSGDGRILLDDYELASRLSYALWKTMPDEALLREAAEGTLHAPGVLAKHVARLLSDARAEPMVLAFHAQLLERERLRSVAPSRARYPELSEHFAEAAAHESDLFVKYQVLERNGSYKDLLSSTETFVNAELARVYGVDAGGDGFSKVSLDPKRRQGLLTQVAFLAAHATSVDPDPIHRGVFVARRLLCKDLVAPASLPPLPTPSGKTMRQAVESLTEAKGSSCAACHKRTINPLGFPFEAYDAIGRYRSEDNGLPVDASSVAVIDATDTPVQDGVGLAAALASSPEAHTCYARRWLEYTYGRPATARDEALLKRIGAESAEGALSVKDLLAELIAAPSFSAIYEADL